MISRFFRLSVLAFLCVSLGLGGYLAPRSLRAQTQPHSDAFKNLLGTDDGAGLAIFYGGDTRGKIEDCGCRAHPMGGLARLAGYAQGFRETYPATPFLEVNVGNFLNDAGANYTPPLKDIEVQNLYALRGYSQFPFDAANISFHDLPYLSRYLTKDQQKTAPVEFPVLKTLISANLTPEAAANSHLPVLPYIIREVKSPRLPKGKIKVGIVGLSEPAPASHLGYLWRDPEKAAREVLPELRKAVDVLVVVAYMPVDKAKLLATSCQEADVMISAFGQTYQVPLEKIGNVAFVTNFNETKFLGELRVKFDAAGKPEITNRYVGLDAVVPDNPTAAALVNEAVAAIDKARQEMIEEQNKRVQQQSAPANQK